jgi:hypothetical protein
VSPCRGPQTYPPGGRERDALALREGGEELGGQLQMRLRARFVFRPDPAAVVVHRVIAAPEDTVVSRKTEVVELVSQVRRAAACTRAVVTAAGSALAAVLRTMMMRPSRFRLTLVHFWSDFRILKDAR